MKETIGKTDIKTLRWFLIRRFLYSILFIYIIEELLSLFLRLWFWPMAVRFLQIEELTVNIDSRSVLYLFLQLFLMTIVSFLPEQIGNIVQRILVQWLGDHVRLGFDVPVLERITDPQAARIYQIALLLLFAFMLMIMLLPYIASALWYGRTVSAKMAELLKEEKGRKEAYDRQRNLLLSDIAHDIRTPLTTVCGYSKALQEGVVSEPEKRQEYLQAIFAKSMRMNELITLLFEYVQLDSDGFSLHKEFGDPGELLRENIALLYADFEEKGITLQIEIPETPFSYEMDRIQLGRAVTNILTNALRYNDRGVNVIIRLREDGQIYIGDNGKKIENDLAEHIFEPFYRGDPARSTEGGTGLGLSIAAKIVEMHGGSLRLEQDCEDGCSKAFIIMLS